MNISVRYRIERDDFLITIGDVELALPTKQARALATALWDEDAKPDQVFAAKSR